MRMKLTAGIGAAISLVEENDPEKRLFTLLTLVLGVSNLSPTTNTKEVFQQVEGLSKKYILRFFLDKSPIVFYIDSFVDNSFKSPINLGCRISTDQHKLRDRATSGRR